jgi:cytochrome bd ubiquinol oxidase subunit I
MELDPYILSRIQFALTISFHYLFPPLTIGLGWLMVIMEGNYLRTGDKEYESIARFWTGIFAVVFAVGVASGIVMEFQFGTNWSNYSRFVGDVFGSALAAEGIFAFFLESGFLAVLVFGWDKVGKKMHFFSTLMVAGGSTFSAVWIVVANAWQQTPAGHKVVPVLQNGEPFLVNGQQVFRAEVVDFWGVVFNPSSVVRLTHVLLGAGILGGFFVLSMAAWYLLKRRHESMACKMMNVALPWTFALSCLMFVSGHAQAVNTAEHQPIKMAATEAHFNKTEGGTPFYIAGFPDQKARKVHFGIPVPKMLSVLLYMDPNKPVPALEEFPEDEWPPVHAVFQMYHIMIGLGSYFVLVSGLALYFWWRGTLRAKRWMLWTLVFSIIGPYISNHAGWGVAEVGRQPWIVYGLLRTADGYSPSISGGEVLFTIIMFSLIYICLFCLWIYLMDMKIRKGPEPPNPASGNGEKGGLLRTVGDLANPSGPSMTSARDETA